MVERERDEIVINFSKIVNWGGIFFFLCRRLRREVDMREKGRSPEREHADLLVSLCGLPGERGQVFRCPRGGVARSAAARAIAAG